MADRDEPPALRIPLRMGIAAAFLGVVNVSWIVLFFWRDTEIPSWNSIFVAIGVAQASLGLGSSALFLNEASHHEKRSQARLSAHGFSFVFFAVGLAPLLLLALRAWLAHMFQGARFN